MSIDYQWRNPDKTPPGGYQFRQAETNWAVPDPMLPRFMIVDQIVTHRVQNPQIHVSAERSDVEQDLVNYNAARLDYNADWFVPGKVQAGVVYATVQAPAPKRGRGCATCGGARR